MKAITITNTERSQDYRITQPQALAAAVIHHIPEKQLESRITNAMTYVTFSNPEIARSLAHNVFGPNNGTQRDMTRWGWTVKEIEE